MRLNAARRPAAGIRPAGAHGKRGENMRILKSSEDYLEAMLMMQERHGYIRSIDIAAELEVTKPSVSYATKRLRENGYITMNRE